MDKENEYLNLFGDVVLKIERIEKIIMMSYEGWVELGLDYESKEEILHQLLIDMLQEEDSSILAAMLKTLFSVMYLGDIPFAKISEAIERMKGDIVNIGRLTETRDYIYRKNSTQEDK